jgi:hypothetical protein
VTNVPLESVPVGGPLTDDRAASGGFLGGDDCGVGGDSGTGGHMVGLDDRLTTAANYRRFARAEAATRSPAYEQLAVFVAGNQVLLDFLTGLPFEKRQPNLLFAAARYLLGVAADADALLGLVTERGPELAAIMRSRRTQTNEAARCALLLPALAMLPQPLALLEVGAAAGLTLLPDRYSYDYDGRSVRGSDPQAPTMSCHLVGPAPLPEKTPTVAWRAGLDLNPLDVNNDDDLDWLACLIWPGEDDRLQRLYDAAAAARRARLKLHQGDLLDNLGDIAAGAPQGATLVVYHTAVLAYVGAAKRAAFATAVADLGATWLSNEAPGVVASLNSDQGGGGFLLGRDGREVLAHTDPHGTWLHWGDG